MVHSLCKLIMCVCVPSVVHSSWSSSLALILCAYFIHFDAFIFSLSQFAFRWRLRCRDSEFFFGQKIQRLSYTVYSDQRSNYCENDRVSTTTSSRTSSKTNNDGTLIMPCNIGGFTTNKKSLLEMWAKLFSTCAKNVPIWRFYTENFFHGAFVSLLCMRVCVNEMWSEKAANSFSLVRFGLNLHISVVALHCIFILFSSPFHFNIY